MSATVLLVDDEAGIRTVLGLALADAGFETLTADSGLAGFELFLARRPEVVITDIKMPGMDGVELLKAIKAESPDAEVIMTTGHGDMDLAVESLRHGAADFIAKPVSTDALEIAIARALEKIDLKRRLREHTEQLERLVEEKTRELLAAERLAAIGQTVAEMSHAVKNLAGGLEGSMFVLEKGLELDNREYVQQGWTLIKRDVARLKEMALNLLRYARPEALPRPSDPVAPAREAVRLLAGRAAEAGVTLALEADEAVGQALIDPEAVHQCLLNLLANAMECFEDEAAEDRRATLTVRRAGDAVVYAVTDNGPGMPPEVLKRLFQGFFSAKGGRGAGVGLMATKKLVERMGGSVAAESREGEGSSFEMRFQAA